jgi:hypothetical protein
MCADQPHRWRAYANKERNQLEAFPERNINPKRLEREIARRKPKPPQKKMNACLSMCFEGANLICHYDNDQEQQEHAAALMGKVCHRLPLRSLVLRLWTCGPLIAFSLLRQFRIGIYIHIVVLLVCATACHEFCVAQLTASDQPHAAHRPDC